MAQVASTHCRVDIIAPNGTQFTFEGMPDVAQALLAVETHKDLSEACGSFTLHFDPRRQPDGRRWDQRIPKRSLVFIDMERSGNPQLPEEHSTVMVGLTDDHRVQESWQDAQPRRVVQIHGREISCTIVDAVLWYHPALAEDPSIGTLTQQLRDLGSKKFALTYNPGLVHPAEDPRAILKRLLDIYLLEGASAVAPRDLPGLQEPVINLAFPNKVTLPDLLQRAPEAHWNTFEPVWVHLPQTPAEVGSLWNLLHLYIDRHFQEFFTRVEGSQCLIHFRGKPFRHALVTSGTRFKSADEEPTLQTLALDPGDVLNLQLQAQTANVYNVFVVDPLGMTDYFRMPSFLYEMLPQIITDPAHPSYVGRYGLRLLHVRTPYLSPLVSTEQEASRPTPQPLQPQPAGAATWAEQANQLAAQQGMPAALRPWFVALIHHESSFNPNAVGQVLKSGNRAEGIAQWVAPYPAGVGLVNPFDPVNALEAAARYWNQMRAMGWIGEDPRLLVAGYNAGPGAVRTHNGIPPFPETQRLVRQVEATMPRYAGLAGVPAAATPQMPPLATTAPQAFPEMVTLAKRWAAILRGWYDMGGELFGGVLTVRGHPAWNVGHRLITTDERGDWEAYIEGVNHRYDMRTGQYLTTLRITRGWYLSDANAAQTWEEGRTAVESASGGPPTIDPAETPGRGEVTITRVRIGGLWYRIDASGEHVLETEPPKE